MVADQQCGPQDGGRAVEACQAEEIATHVSIRCKLVRTIPNHPYVPDDFELELRSDAVMTGLLTADWNTPAIWRRGDQAAPAA